MISVEDREEIRRAYFIEQRSRRWIEREMGYSRRTVNKALAQAESGDYTLREAREAPVLGPYKPQIESLLEESKRMPRKQHYTGHKIYEAIHGSGYRGSESGVQVYLWQRRRENNRPEVFVPLGFDPGQDAQVDWGQAVVEMNGERETVQFIEVRLNYSRKAMVRAYPCQKQEAFFEGQVAAFQYFGGVPHRLSYDNLTSAVQRVLQGRGRREQRRFTAFRSHYLFEAHFCTPGEGHEKGGVENGIGYAQRNLFVPLIQTKDYEDLNAQLMGLCQEQDTRKVHGQTLTIGEAYAQERGALLPLPAHAFDCYASAEVTLNGYGQVTYETNRYSVPAKLARKQLVLHAYPFWVEILDSRQVIATHPRCYDREQEIFNALHYLPLLERRPGALEYAKPIRAIRESWPAVYERALSQLKREDSPGIREFVRILRLQEEFSATEVEAALEAALGQGKLSADAVRLHIRQRQKPEVVLPPMDLSHLTQGDKLQSISQQPVQLQCYDQLLLPAQSRAAVEPGAAKPGGGYDLA
jgi:transposase